MHTAIEFNDTTDVRTCINHRHHFEGNTFEIELYDDNGRLTLYLSDELARELSSVIQSEFVADALAVPGVVLAVVCDTCGHDVESDGDVSETSYGIRSLEWWQHTESRSSFCTSVDETAGTLDRAEVNGTRRVDGVRVAVK